MYKPPFFILFFLLLTTFVSAQDDGELRDTVVTMAQPASKEQAVSTTFDAVGKIAPVTLRTVPKKVVDSLKAADDFWYANAAPAKKKENKEVEPELHFLQKRWFRSLLWVIILGSFIGVVIWYLVSGNILIFRKRAKLLCPEEETAEDARDIFSLPYDQEIEAATAAGNYRLAVRLRYLQTLKTLAEKGLIDYRYGRTNQDYVSQLSRHSASDDFFRLTRNFEYTWYGQFPLSAEAYGMLQTDFIQFQKSLP